MALSDTLVRKTFMNLEIFLQKAAALDIFEALIFNYKVKIGLLDPLAIHFFAIVTELANQLQLLSQETSDQKDFVETFQISVSNSDVNVRKPDTHTSRTSEPVLLSIKTEEQTEGDEPLVFSLFDDGNTIPETQITTKNAHKSLHAVPSKEDENNPTSTKVKQRSLKSSHIKKGDNQGKSERKNVIQSETSTGFQEVYKHFKHDSCDSSFLIETKCQKDVSPATKVQSRSSRMYKCNHCDMVFTARKFLTTHMNRIHKAGNDAITEDVSNGSCTVSEDSIPGLSDEMQSLPENLPFFCCKTCLVVFKTHTEFEIHNCKNGMGSVEEGTILHNYIQLTGKHLIINLDKLKALKKYKCGLCHEEYRSMARMSYHLPRCTQGPYKCELCSEEYMFKKDLNLHKKKSHRGANSFFCDECGLTFKFRTSLQKHKVNRHETEQGPFSCEECGKNFVKRIQLTNHKINTHRLERKFLCQVCGNKFSNYGSLMAHLDTHTETRRFSCNYCNKKFRQKEKLKYHTRIHTGERPHLCQTCGKGFIRKSKLDEHMRRHRGEKRYHCSICNKSYAAGWDLKLHNKKQHPDSVESVASSTSPPVLQENIPTVHLSSVKNDDEDPDDPLELSGPTEENETAGTTSEQATPMETSMEEVNLSSVQANSQALGSQSSADSDRSRILVQLNSNPQQQEQRDNQIIVQNGNVNSTNSSILVQLNNPMQTHATPISQEASLGNSNPRILVQLDSTQIQNQPLILNSNSSNSNSKIIVQHPPSAQQPQSNTASDSNSNRILLHLDSPLTQNAQTALIHNGSTTSNNSRILLQLDHGQSQSLPPNTVLTVADAIHLAPLVDDVNSINLGNVTAQYIHLTTAQPDNTVSSNSAVTNGNNSVPLHIQLPVSAVQVPVSAISQQGSGSTAYELQSLSVQGQTGLVFASAGFDVSSITY